MLETSARLLRLLSLLQARPDWTGRELADRLGVTSRTVRTDIERLRSLGYPVHATPGPAGGYRLGPGATLPPLLLDDDEAVAVAIGLRTGAGGTVVGIEESSVRALAKLEQLLPSRLRHRVDAMRSATVTVPGSGPAIDAGVLTAIATTIRANEPLRFDYIAHDGATSRREVEPHRLVNWGRRWYLVAWDADRAGWRTFRVDRVSRPRTGGRRFTPRLLPDQDVSTLVQRGVGSAVWRFRAQVLVHAPAEQVAARLPVAVTVEPAGADSCVVEVGSDTAQMLGLHLGLLDVDFEVLDNPELARAFGRLADRYRRAARPGGGGERPPGVAGSSPPPGAGAAVAVARPSGADAGAPSPRRVLLCEPYYAGSHRAWADGLVRHSRHDVRLVTHKGGFWRWRMQGAALTLAEQIDDQVAAWGRPDVVVAGDMVHLPALLGLARRSLAGVPVVLYMHENQLTYPLPAGAAPDHTYAMINWLGLAAADRVVFNSEHHRRDVLGALPRFLRQFPDHRHTGEVERVAAASTVLPVGVDLDRFDRPRTDHDPPVVLWNHRWEYDKDPAAFFRALAAVAEAGVAFSVVVAGERFPTVPEAFAEGRAMLGPRLRHFGTATDDEYPALLAATDVVVSTARHEFFGLAVVEAVAAGALPLLPARLSYPELVPGRDPFLYDGEDDLVRRLAWALTHPDERRRAAREAQAYVRRFGWPVVAPRYDDLLAGVAAGEPAGR